MKSIKIIIAAVFVMAGMSVMGQWSTNGDHIYNTNIGNVGIGTTTPTENLHIVNSDDEATFFLDRPYSGVTDTKISKIRLRNSTSNDLFNISLRYNGGNYEMIQSAYSSSIGGWLEYSYLNLTTADYEMRPGISNAYFLNSGDVFFNNTGNVGIGTETIPSSYALAVNGSIICEGLTVELNTEWPDYVFNNNYNLRSLDEVETFIKDNGHLPGISSAKDIKENGLSVGEINKQLMEKVEELTLYVIELQKQVDELKK